MSQATTVPALGEHVSLAAIIGALASSPPRWLSHMADSSICLAPKALTQAKPLVKGMSRAIIDTAMRETRLREAPSIVPMLSTGVGR